MGREGVPLKGAPSLPKPLLFSPNFPQPGLFYSAFFWRECGALCGAFGNGNKPG